MKTLLALVLTLITSLASAETKEEFSFQENKSIDDIINNQIAFASGIEKFNLTMEVNLRCIAALATLSNSLNPEKETDQINEINLRIGNIFIMTSIIYDSEKNGGQLARNNRRALMKMMLPKVQELQKPYLEYYGKLLDNGSRRDFSEREDTTDLDSCYEVERGYYRALVEQGVSEPY